MATLVTDPGLEKQIREERSHSGKDFYDEVWEGTYVMTPVPNLEHQDIGTGLVTILRMTIDWPGLGKAYQSVNVSDREEGWQYNYRVPDLAVTMKNTKARYCDTHFCGGPDFLVEIASENDLSRKKFQFYASIGVREPMLIDRDPWCIELYRLDAGELRLVGKSLVGDSTELASAVIPLSFRLLPANIAQKSKSSTATVCSDGLFRRYHTSTRSSGGRYILSPGLMSNAS